ncbi:hypothetical protein RR42_s3482 [Cupriavidus basilensis]|uniref:Uncharacterized protein n=1 Tax=Cupriavidus basilensis TaxID=68895 RepID=A0A0C4YPU3_9BURK|nr:hypothetical protein RR42_s3482 [Cupriavidus basilensis]
MRTNLFLKSFEPNHEPAHMQTLKIDPLYLKTTLPDAGKLAHRRRDDDAS